MEDTPDNIECIRLASTVVALIDSEDYERLAKHKWSIMSSKSNGIPAYYGQRSGWFPDPENPLRMKRGHKILHREVLQYDGPLEVDHIDGNTLDNRKSNLRLVTTSQNQMNRGISYANKSGFKGVSWNKASKKWMAQIKANNVHYYLGLFDTKEEAAAAYSAKAQEVHGEFTRAA